MQSKEIIVLDTVGALIKCAVLNPMCSILSRACFSDKSFFYIEYHRK